MFFLYLQNGNIAELLLREGFARCVDWSMGVVSQGADKLRAAEKLVCVYDFKNLAAIIR